MKLTILFIFYSFIIFSVNSFTFAHGQETHKYMTYQAYQVLKNYAGEIPEIEDALGVWYDSYYEGDYAFQRQTIVTGAYREDEEDLVFGYDGYLLSGWDIDIDDWIVSITHFWDADDGDNAMNYFYATIPSFPSGKIHKPLGTFPNSYQKMLKFANPNRFWEIKFKMTPGEAEFRLASGELIYIDHCGGVGFEYNSLIELYKTGKAWITGYYACPLANWQSCNYEVILGQGYRDALVWEILGRMCHLIEDLSVPAHAHKDEHGYYEDPYENYMKTPSNYVIQPGTISLLNPYIYQISDPLHFLMYVVQQVTDHFASRGEDQNGWGDDNLSGNGTTAEVNFINSNYPLSTLGKPNTPTEANMGTWNDNIRSVTYPLSIGAVAGLLYWFAVETEMIERIIEVPRDYPTIESALSAAISGQTILVTGSQTIANNLSVQSNITLNFTSSATLNLNGYTITQNGGLITIEEGAVIDGTLLKTGGTINAIYYSIQAALGASSAGQTVEVIGSQTVSDNLSVQSGVTLNIASSATVNLNGHTIFQNGGCYNSR